jgi:hypothetical protein
LTLKDGLLAGADVNGQQSKRIGPTTAHSISSSSIGAGISDSNDSSINPPTTTTTTLLHHQPFDSSDEMALTVVKPSYPSIEMNMEDYV